MAKIKKRKDGRYSRKIYVGKKHAKDVDGKPRFDAEGNPVMIKDYVSVYGHSPKEVDDAYMQLKVDMGKGVDIKAANDSFALWAERFISNKEAQGMSPGHITSLKGSRKHLAPLDAIPISKIAIGDIQSIIDKLAQYHPKDPAKPWGDMAQPLSKRTLLGIKQTAEQILKLAVASRVITYNPAEYVIVPKNATTTKRDAITEQQQQWIRDTEHRAKRAAMIMLYAGLRRGELLALTWADINLANRTLDVNKTVMYTGNQPILKHGAKTQSSVRTVKIPKILNAYLSAEKGKDNCIYVIHTQDGKLMSQSAWKRLWESYMAELNFKYGFTSAEKESKNITSRLNPHGLEMRIDTFTAHQLRHTCCTNMYFAGVDMLVASKQLGHSSVQTTWQIYTHLDEKHGDKSMDKLDKYLGALKVRQGTKNNTSIRFKTGND